MLGTGESRRRKTTRRKKFSQWFEMDVKSIWFWCFVGKMRSAKAIF